MTDMVALPDIAISEIKYDSAEIEHLVTPFKVSRIGLGTWAIGGWMWGGTDERAAIAVIHEALDRGITLFDTAPVYGFGRSEEILGKALEEGGRRSTRLSRPRSALIGGRASLSATRVSEHSERSR